MPEKTVPVKARRILSTDYDWIAEFVEKELGNRESLQFRKDHEALWKEVDRQVRMKPMAISNTDPDESWKSALEMGDLSTASEVLSADVLRLIFPQDRSWLKAHANLEFKRLQARTDKEITQAEKAKVQKKADSEIQALMTQQHKDFGFRDRVELSTKEALHHGSFVAEVEWEQVQQFGMNGVFKSSAAPVWTPHSMWNCYPETLELGVNLIYKGSMIITTEKSYEWVIRQTNFINKQTFKDKTTDKKSPVKITKYIGDITIERKGENVYLPNMKVFVANKTVIFAKPNDHATIIYGGYDRIDLRDPYYLSPLVKQSSNHKIVTILANKFLDGIDLKIQPPGTYDGNDPALVAQGGPKVIPAHMTATKGGANNTKFMDVGDLSWAAQGIEFFQGNIKEGTGVSATRAGATRQADRITATQIEEESAGSNLRTVDFVGKMEKGVLSFTYMQHESNKVNMKVYKFYNPEMGMDDFDELRKDDLPEEIHFEAVGSKGVLTERRRSEQTSAVMSFLLSNEKTADLPNIEEMARQMLLDAGNKNPERLLNVSEDNTEIQKKIEALQAKMQEVIDELRTKLQEVSQKLVESEMEVKNTKELLKLRGERAEGTETSLREEVRALKAQIDRSTKLMQELGAISDETIKNERIKEETEKLQAIQAVKDQSKDVEKVKDSDGDDSKKQNQTVVVIGKAAGFNVVRNEETGDMKGIVAVDDANEITG